MASYAAQLQELEAEYSRLYDEIERKYGGVDYRCELQDLRRRIEDTRKNAQHFEKMRQAVEMAPSVAAKIVAEEIIEQDDPEEIAAEFVENELGRFDWIENWRVIQLHEDPVLKVDRFMKQYGLQGDPVEVVNIVNSKVTDNPGKWK